MSRKKPPHDPDMSVPKSRALFWKDLVAMDRPAVLVKGILDKGCFGEIYGPFHCGKSFLAVDIGLHVATGQRWRGRRTLQGGVLYVSAESGTGIINRLDAWQRHHGVDMNTVPFAAVLAETSLLDESGVDQIITDACAVPELVLVIIDTAARTMQGSDEGAEDMGIFVAACDRIRDETGACVLVVHHCGKDVGKGSRGSTVLPAAVDAAIEVKNTKGIITATVVKQRDGESGAEIHSRLERIELGTDEDGDPVTSCVLLPTEESPTSDAGLSANQQSMFTILQSAMPEGLTIEEWNTRARQAGLGVKRRTDLLDYREALKRKKLIHEFNDRWYASK